MCAQLTFPLISTSAGRYSVHAVIRVKKANAPKNFPITTWASEMGAVCSNTMVPVCRSSANVRMLNSTPAIMVVPEEKQVSAKEVAAVSLVQEMGYITCPLQPWSDVGLLGRITDWPRSKPPQKRSVSIKCLIHGGNCVMISTRSKVKDQDLLEWLFFGHCLFRLVHPNLRWKL